MPTYQTDGIPNTIISDQAIVDARAQYDQGNTTAAWQLLANAGDRYADNSVAVTQNKGTLPFNEVNVC